MSPRERILDALLALIADRGIDAVSVRTVAAAAEVSPALVQYHFGTKDRLMAAAFAHVHERMADRLAAVPAGGTVRDRLRGYLLAWFPLDAERRADATVWLAFTAASATRPDLVAEVRDTDDALLGVLAEVVERGRADGSVRADVDANLAAAVLLAVVDGLTIRAVTDPDPRRLLPVLDAALTHLLDPEGTST